MMNKMNNVGLSGLLKIKTMVAKRKTKSTSYLFQGTGNPFGNIIRVFFLCFTIYIIVLVAFKDRITLWIDSLFGSGFSVSIFASFLEDFIFFGTLGLFTTIITLRKPEDEDISVRIRSVINGRNIGENAKQYFEKATKAVLAYNSHLQIVIKLKDIDVNNKAIRIHVEFMNTIKNMCRDIPFTEVRTSSIVKPALCVDDSYGEVTHLSIIDKANFSNKIAIVEGDSINIPSTGFSKLIPYQISEDSEANYKFCFWIWSEITEDNKKENNWFYLPVTRYTDSCTIIVKNEVNIVDEISMIIKYPNRTQNQTHEEKVIRDDSVAKSHEKTLVSNIILFPDDRFKVYFKLFGVIDQIQKKEENVE